jgi:hypothetical protein
VEKVGRSDHNEYQASGAEGADALLVEYMGLRRQRKSTKSTGVWEEAVAAVNGWNSVLETEERGSGGYD